MRIEQADRIGQAGTKIREKEIRVGTERETGVILNADAGKEAKAVTEAAVNQGTAVLNKHNSVGILNHRNPYNQSTLLNHAWFIKIPTLPHHPDLLQ